MEENQKNHDDKIQYYSNVECLLRIINLIMSIISVFIIMLINIITNDNVKYILNITSSVLIFFITVFQYINDPVRNYLKKLINKKDNMKSFRLNIDKDYFITKFELKDLVPFKKYI